MEQDQEIQFMSPVHFYKLAANDIHVWKFPVVNADVSYLSESEQAFAFRFHFESDRNRFVVGRQAIRFLLSKYLSVNPEEIVITSDKGQKPVISSPAFPIHFNISHSRDLVLVAIGGKQLGVDLEKIDAAFDYTALLEEHFSDAERKFMAAAQDPRKTFYFIWTRKEALTKAWGTGLLENLKEVSALETITRRANEKKSWNVKSFYADRQYPAAIAYTEDSVNFVFLDGNSLRLSNKKQS